MLLLKGVTGFLADDVKPLDLVGFKRFMYTLPSWIDGFRIMEIQDESASPRSYAVCRAEYKAEAVDILINLHYPFLALRKDETFIDHPVLSPVIRTVSRQFALPYRLLSKEELLEPLRLHHGNHQLGDAELCQIGYWEPQIVGEVIFNEWD